MGDAPVSPATDADGLVLGATVAEIHHRLASGLAEPDRTTDRLGERADEEFLGVDADLRAEAATDIRGDDADLVLRNPVGLGDLTADALGMLGGHPLVQASPLPGGRGGARFHRAGGHTLVEGLDGDDDLAVGEELLTGVR